MGGNPFMFQIYPSPHVVTYLVAARNYAVPTGRATGLHGSPQEVPLRLPGLHRAPTSSEMRTRKASSHHTTTCNVDFSAQLLSLYNIV